MPARKVQVIESRVSLNTGVTLDGVPRKKRVAAYARVSTDSEEQLSSYEAQVEFYTRHIQDNPEWEFVAVYTDEGISGTNTKKREGFNRMIADALDGKIDLILTKSISRFARNTVDTLTAVRRLKEKRVEVYFEKENIYTLDAKGEVMITIMSSLAQEESRSISENVTWGKRKSMEEGKFSLAYSCFLGYEKGADGLPKIVEKEAEVIRTIYRLFLEGYTVRRIADLLTAQGIPTPRGRMKWSVSTIMSILQNEKYKGDALLQKTFTADFLTKKVKKNQGEVPQYYIHNSHPAIIDPDTFDLVQTEIKRRRPERCRLHRNSPFTGKIVCEECGSYYGRKTWHSGTKYKKRVWQCNGKYQGQAQCPAPTINETDLEASFVIAFNKLLGDKERYVARFEELLPFLADVAPLEKELQEARETHADLMNGLRCLMQENTRLVQDQEAYNRQFQALDQKCQKAEKQIARIQEEIQAQIGRKEQICRCLEELKKCKNLLTEFDLDLWTILVDKVTVQVDKTFTYHFQDGTKIPVKLPVKS